MLVVVSSLRKRLTVSGKCYLSYQELDGNGSGEKQLNGTWGRNGRERECVCVCALANASSKKTESWNSLMRSVLVSRSDTEPACVFCCCYLVDRMAGKVVATVFAAVSLAGVPGEANVSTTFMS